MFLSGETPLTVLVLIAIIAGIVESAKQFGVNGKASLGLSLGLGVVLGILFELQYMYPDITPWLKVVVGGLVTALAASGLYDLGKRYTGQ